MAIDLTLLFRRLARLAGLLKATAAHQQNDLAFGVAHLLDDFAAMPGPVAALLRAPKIPELAAGQALANVNLEAYVTDAARRALIETVTNDQPTEAWDVPKAVAEVIRQMRQQGATVADCAVGYSVAPSPLLANPGEPNSGTGYVIVGLRQPTYIKSDNVFAEAVRLSVADASTPGSEGWAVRGGVPATGLWNYDWPAGSGAVAALTTCDPAAAAPTILLDGSFEAWTTVTQTYLNVDGHGGVLFNTPYPVTFPALTDWTFYDEKFTDTGSGSYVTNLANRQSTAAFNAVTGQTRYAAVVMPGYAGSSVVGTTYVNTTGAIYQPVTVAPVTAYGFAAAVKLPAAGTVRVALTDAATGTPGTPLADLGGNPLSASHTATGAEAGYAVLTGVWTTPRTLPFAVRLTVSVTLGAAAAQLATVDHVCLFPLTYPYPGGPALGVVRGNRDWQVGDSLEVTITNDRAGAFAGFTWQAVFDRLFGDRANGLYLPTSGAPTVADSLILPATVPPPPPPPPSSPPPPPPPATGAMTVHAFYDTNANGTQGTGEGNAAGRLVVVSGPTPATGTTNGAGDAVFGGLAPGAYTAVVSLLAGEACATNASGVTVTAGATATPTRPITLPPPPPPPPGTGGLTTHVWFDTNANGSQDTGEPDLAGRTVVAVNGGSSFTATTNGAGVATFAGLTPAAYAVTLYLLAGESCAGNGGAVTVTAGGTAAANRPVTAPAQTVEASFSVNFGAVVGTGTLNGGAAVTGTFVTLGSYAGPGTETAVWTNPPAGYSVTWDVLGTLYNNQSGTGATAVIPVSVPEHLYVRFNATPPPPPPPMTGGMMMAAAATTTGDPAPDLVVIDPAAWPPFDPAKEVQG